MLSFHQLRFHFKFSELAPKSFFVFLTFGQLVVPEIVCTRKSFDEMFRSVAGTVSCVQNFSFECSYGVWKFVKLDSKSDKVALFCAISLWILLCWAVVFCLTFLLCFVCKKSQKTCFFLSLILNFNSNVTFLKCRLCLSEAVEFENFERFDRIANFRVWRSASSLKLRFI